MKVLSPVIAAVLVVSLCPASAAYASVYGSLANGGYTTGVTKEISAASYWQDLAGSGGNKVLANASSIAAVNQAAIDGSGTSVVDVTHDYGIKNISIANEFDSAKTYYVDGQAIDTKAYYDNMCASFEESKWTNYGEESKWAVCTKSTALMALPSSDFFGYSSTDQDNELQNSALLVNEPFQVRQRCVVDGETFYWGTSRYLNGWVSAEDMAICAGKQQWLDSWQVELDARDFIVITQTRLKTEPSFIAPSIGDIELQLGTTLKLVADEDIPSTVDGRGTQHNYVVYLPTRADDGSYVKEIALIPERYSISEGYLPYTENNLIAVAMGCVGDRYGWGGCLDSMDCSLLVRQVYRCFGYELPRNTTFQQRVPGVSVSLAGLSDKEKVAAISTLPAGTALYFPGHTMIYLGIVNGIPYVVSDVGSCRDTSEAPVSSIYSVAVTPLTVARRSDTTSGGSTSNTWLTWLDGAVVLAPQTPKQADIKVTLSCTSFKYNGKTKKPKVTVSTSTGFKVPDSYYTVSMPKSSKKVGTYKVTVTFDNNVVRGSLTKTYKIKKASKKKSSKK